METIWGCTCLDGRSLSWQTVNSQWRRKRQESRPRRSTSLVLGSRQGDSPKANRVVARHFSHSPCHGICQFRHRRHWCYARKQKVLAILNSWQIHFIDGETLTNYVTNQNKVRFSSVPKSESLCQNKTKMEWSHSKTKSIMPRTFRSTSLFLVVEFNFRQYHTLPARRL